MIDQTILAGILKTKQHEAEQSGIDVNVLKMWECFYSHHKQKHGTYRHLQDDYFEKMQERQVYCLKQIDEVIEGKKYYKASMEPK